MGVVMMVGPATSGLTEEPRRDRREIAHCRVQLEMVGSSIRKFAFVAVIIANGKCLRKANFYHSRCQFHLLNSDTPPASERSLSHAWLQRTDLDTPSTAWSTYHPRHMIHGTPASRFCAILTYLRALSNPR